MLTTCLECVRFPSRVCSVIFAETGKSDPTITAEIQTMAIHNAIRRGRTIPNAEIGFDPAEPVRSSSDIDLTIHDKSSRASTFQRFFSTSLASDTCLESQIAANRPKFPLVCVPQTCYSISSPSSWNVRVALHLPAQKEGLRAQPDITKALPDPERAVACNDVTSSS